MLPAKTAVVKVVLQPLSTATTTQAATAISSSTVASECAIRNCRTFVDQIMFDFRVHGCFGAPCCLFSEPDCGGFGDCTAGATVAYLLTRWAWARLCRHARSWRLCCTLLCLLSRRHHLATELSLAQVQWPCCSVPHCVPCHPDVAVGGGGGEMGATRATLSLIISCTHCMSRIGSSAQTYRY